MAADCPGCNASNCFATKRTLLPPSVKESTDSKSPLRSKKSTDSPLPAQCSDFAVPVITALKTNS